MKDAPDKLDALKDNPALGELALAQMHHVCKGNGVRLRAITLTSCQTGDIHADAYTYLELRPQISEKTEKGRHEGGNSFASKDEITAEIDRIMLEAIRNGATRKEILNTILTREDKGFGIQNTNIPLPFLTHDFSWHEPCGNCAGEGKSSCPKCRGQMLETCHQCQGRGVSPCVLCRGRGRINGANGAEEPCPKCRGQRQMECLLCRRRGKITCRQCSGSGAASCPSCAGTGWFTHLVHLLTQAIPYFDFDRSNLPHEAIKILDKNPHRLIKNKSITINASALVEDESEDDDDNDTPRKLGVHYKVIFPFGEAVFKIGKTNIRGSVFGYDGRLIGFPPFLEQMIKKGLSALKEAADGHGMVAQKLNNAAKFKFIAQALILARTDTPARAVKRLRQRYPVGIRIEGIQHIVAHIHAALSHITKIPRLIGLSAGLGGAGLLYSVYFLLSIRGIVGGALQNIWAMIGIDLLLCLGGIALTLFSIKLFSNHALDRALGRGGQKTKRGKSLPLIPLEPFFMASYAATILLFFAIIFLGATFMTGADIPFWVSKFL